MFFINRPFTSLPTEPLGLFAFLETANDHGKKI